jgi:ATP-binding cassette subfamily B protein
MVLERGTHRELLEQNGRYAEMWACSRSSEEAAVAT